jgi:hypothetical protein
MAHRTFIVPRHIYSGPGALETAGRISREMGYFPEGAAYPL